VADHVLEDEGRAVGIRGLADVGRDLELGVDGLVDVDELAGARERFEVRAEVGRGPPPDEACGYRSAMV
jgi:hypothetical protein